VETVKMPVNFKYREAYMKGRPQHDRLDPFSIRHPKMDVGRRAKIFAPFDALKGFDEALAETAQRMEISGAEPDEDEEGR